MEFREKYLINISNQFPALEELNDNDDIHKTWEDIKDCIKLLAGRMFTMLSERKQAEMQWLQIANQSNEDDLNNVRRETSRCFKKNIF